jgi:hypothetical protein
MLAPGSYLGLLVSGTPGASPEKKSPLIDVTFKIVSRAGTNGWEDVTPPMDRRVSIYLSDAAWTYSERKLEQLGFNGSFRQPDFSDESKTTGVILNCSHEDYKGKPVEKWEIAFGGGGSKLEDMPTDVARVMEAKWRATHGAKPTPKPAAKPAAKSAPAPAPAAPPPPAPVPGNGITRDEAWSQVIAGHGNNNEDALAAWQKAIKKIGKDESAMTAADWFKVAEDAAIPF